MSTEFGYWLSDLVFQRKKARREIVDFWSDYVPSNPSFIGFTAGFQFPLSDYEFSDEYEYYTSTGSTIGLEGAWFWNTHWGVGGRATMSSVYYSVEDVDNENGDAFRFQMYQPGIYFNQNIFRHLYFGAKALVGLNHYNRIRSATLKWPSRYGVNYSTGISFGSRVNEKLDISFSIDYNALPPHSRKSGEYIHTLGLNARASFRI